MILYFSATGNSKYVAERIAKVCHDSIQSIEKRKDPIHLAQGECFGIVTPTYCWQLPILMRNFLKNMQYSAEGDHYIFLVATYGSTPGFIGEDTKRLLAAKEIVLDASFSIKMPDTWTPIFDLSNPVKVAQQNRKAEKNILDVLERIKAGEKGNQTERKQPYAMHVIMDPLYHTQRQTKNFYVEDVCMGCSLCSHNCPMQAIQMENDRPVWVKNQCAACLRCLHYCPQFAIQYGTGKTKIHGQYRNPNTNG